MIVLSQCYKCGHYLEADICEAFPGGIPIEIFKGKHDHHQPFPGDHDIQFKQA